VDKLVQRANASLLVGTSSWKEQFIEAISVSAGENCNLFLICIVKGNEDWFTRSLCVCL